VSPDSQSDGPEGPIHAEATLVLFGFESTPATAYLLPRPRSWRMGGALRIVAASLLVAPVVGLIPPHAPWVVGALGGGLFLARRRWRERFTVDGVEGTCPKCGARVVSGRGRLRNPHPVPCEGCHHESRLEVGIEAGTA
jgi:hypothetical protein